MCEIENWAEIIEIIRGGRCVPFLGAGASTSYTLGGVQVVGVPLGGYFTKEFNKRSGLNGSGPPDFNLAAEQLVFQQSGSRHGIEEIITQEIAKVPEPRPIHHVLARIEELRFFLPPITTR